jgi:30S ribosomal protein S31
MLTNLEGGLLQQKAAYLCVCPSNASILRRRAGTVIDPSKFVNIALQATFAFQNLMIMGRGDKKTKKGKITIGSHGNSRPAKEKNEKTKIKSPKES